MSADTSPSSSFDTLLEQAYDAFDRGDLATARRGFEAALEHQPDDARYRYMLGLVCKYLRDWPASLAQNLHAIALHDGQDEHDEASLWNAAIAATALGDWREVRRLWAMCGIRVPDGDGPIEGDYGVVSVRLNPWGSAETLYARRIDPVRARVLNIPLPESGYRRGDIVLHDGASTGQRALNGRSVPVFNALQRLQTSEFKTFAVFVVCPSQADLDALLAMRVPGIDDIEDWTSGVVYYCMRCSYGTPHRKPDNDHDPHALADDGAWESDRNLGIAAQSRHSVERLLDAWVAKAPGRYVDGIGSREIAPSSPPESGSTWWDSPDEDDGGEDAQDDAEQIENDAEPHGSDDREDASQRSTQ